YKPQSSSLSFIFKQNKLDFVTIINQMKIELQNNSIINLLKSLYLYIKLEIDNIKNLFINPHTFSLQCDEAITRLHWFLSHYLCSIFQNFIIDILLSLKIKKNISFTLHCNVMYIIIISLQSLLKQCVEIFKLIIQLFHNKNIELQIFHL